MKNLYLECNMGAAGDMLAGALFELLDDEQKNGVLKALQSSEIDGVTISFDPVVKSGIKGTKMNVEINGVAEGHEHNHEHHHEHEHHEHQHSGMHDIENIVRGLAVSEKVKSDVLAVYGIIANAEASAHGCSVELIHFHEVGALDAVADVTAVCLMMEALSPDRVYVSPVHTGFGSVHCAHGILPVPAPATAKILEGIPSAAGKIEGELCTPTGAALIKYFADFFGEMPLMTVEKTGYGMGSKDFPVLNAVRAFYGETDQSENDEIFEISCNLDDMTAEEIGFAFDRLFESGAADVWTTSAGMKKNRPGTVLSCLCTAENHKNVIAAVFKYTSTLGIREHLCRRYTLERSFYTANSPYGQLRIKRSSGFGVNRIKPEYDDTARLAKENGITLNEIKKSITEK